MGKQPKKRPAVKTRFSLYLDPQIHAQLLRRALDESATAGHRISATVLVERLIAAYLKKGGRA